MRTADCEALWKVMASAEREDGEPPAKKRKTGDRGQRNTLEGWLKKT